MKRWSLKVRFGLYAAMLSMLTVLVGTIAMLALLHAQQIRDLDEILRTEADELFRDLQHFRDAPENVDSALPESIIPLPLRARYLSVRGPKGDLLYRSENLGEEAICGPPNTTRTVRIHDQLCRVGCWQEGPYVVSVGAPLDPLEKIRRDLLYSLLLTLPLVGALVYFGGALLGRRAIAPIAGLTSAAERISTLNPHERLPRPQTRDEIARLTEVLNQSFDRLQQSYATATRFSSDASHQLKTPVAILRAGLDHLASESGLTESQLAEISLLRQQTRRLTTLIEDLLLLAQVDAGRLAIDAKFLDLKPLLEACADDLDTLTADRDLRVTTSFPDSLPVKADRRRLSLVLQNLVENAVKYTPDGGQIDLTAEHQHAWVTVRVRNTGNPIPEGDRTRIFDRFHRGSVIGENVRGHGLGLSIARELVRAHGGDLRLTNPEPGWIEFEFRVPAHVAESSSGD